MLWGGRLARLINKRARCPPHKIGNLFVASPSPLHSIKVQEHYRELGYQSFWQ